MAEHLSYTVTSLKHAANLAMTGADGSSDMSDSSDLSSIVITAAAAVSAGIATLRGCDAARLSKAAHDILTGGGLAFASEDDATLDEEDFAERRRTIAGAALHNAQLLAERLYDGFNTERGIRIFSRGRADARVLSDGDVEVIIPFRFDDDAPEAASANFVARFDAATLSIIEASALDSENDRFGFVSSVIHDEISHYSRGGLATGYRMELEASVSDPRRGRVLSDEERATIIGGWVPDYVSTASGISNIQASELSVTERLEGGAFRMEASACYDKDDRRFRAKLVLHVATAPFYIDAVVLDERDHAVAWLEMVGREQAYRAAALTLNEAWASDYELRRGGDPLRKHLDQTEFCP
jgi:hypothetical protein